MLIESLIEEFTHAFDPSLKRHPLFMFLLLFADRIDVINDRLWDSSPLKDLNCANKKSVEVLNLFAELLPSHSLLGLRLLRGSNTAARLLGFRRLSLLLRHRYGCLMLSGMGRSRFCDLGLFGLFYL
jgi:hypothetical protein